MMMIMTKPPSLTLSGRRPKPGTKALPAPRVGRTRERGSRSTAPEPSPAAVSPLLTEHQDDRVVRCREALRILGVSRATLYRMPIKRVKITEGPHGAVGWWLSDLRLHLTLRTG